jgi:type IV pilus assembly protein PilA
MGARMSANESSAAGSIRTVNTAEVSYDTTYPTVGFDTLAALGGAQPCTPAVANGCFIGNFLATNGNNAGKDGYSFSICSDQTGVIYNNAGASTCTNANTPLQ